MNNWLGFSLSGAAPTDGATDCFGLPASSTDGILEALHRPTNQSPQEWGIKGMDEEEQPKLEDFLGAGAGGYVFSGASVNLPADSGGGGGGGGLLNHSSNQETNTTTNTTNSNNNNNNSSSIGLSMIKNWLRNQPAPPVLPGPVSDAMGLSMSTASPEMPLVALAAAPAAAVSGGADSSSSKGWTKTSGGAGGLDAQSGAMEAVPRKSIDTFGQRTSIYRGVTRHRWTGRYEAHLWDNSCRREGQTRKGRQVYLGGYDKEDKAAKAYDLAALKYWGTTTTTNFPISNYEKELEEMKHMTRQEYVASLRRKSSGFSRGASIYRGVTRHHQHGRWQARIGRVAGNKDLYLGTFSTQEEAAEAYDIAAIKFRGLNAVTNFDMSRYDVKSILESSTLPIGGAAKRLKDVSDHTDMSVDSRRSDNDHMTSQLTDGIGSYGSHHYGHHGWPSIAFQPTQPFSLQYPYSQSRIWCKQEQDGAVVAAAKGLHDLQQLHLASNTHNFFQPSAIQNLMGVDVSSPSVDHSTSSNSLMYNGGIGYHGAMGSGGGAYAMPIATMVVDQSQSNQATNSYGDDTTMAAASDPYGGRNLYYLSQESPGSDLAKENGYEQSSSGCNNWTSSSMQAMAQRANNGAVCHGAPLFSVWNDA